MPVSLERNEEADGTKCRRDHGMGDFMRGRLKSQATVWGRMSHPHS